MATQEALVNVASTSLPLTRRAVPVLNEAWEGLLLGVALEIVAEIVLACFGVFPTAAQIAAGLAQKVSWSVIVCVALGIGTTSFNTAQPLVGGIAGLMAAPAAFFVARTLYKAVESAWATNAVPVAAAVVTSAPSLYTIAAIKAVEFAALGLAVAWLGTRRGIRAGSYATLGLVVGLVFGGCLVGYTAYASIPIPATAKLVTQGVNELLYPIGCAVILYSVTASERRLGQSMG